MSERHTKPGGYGAPTLPMHQNFSHLKDTKPAQVARGQVIIQRPVLRRGPVGVAFRDVVMAILATIVISGGSCFYAGKVTGRAEEREALKRDITEVLTKPTLTEVRLALLRLLDRLNSSQP